MRRYHPTRNRLLNLFHKKTTITYYNGCIKVNICDIDFALFAMNYLTPCVRLDMQYVQCSYSSLHVISINSFRGCTLVVQDQIGAKLHLELQMKANIGNFFTIKLPLESADQALFNGLICLNEA
jgi:hypothetical protein